MEHSYTSAFRKKEGERARNKQGGMNARPSSDIALILLFVLNNFVSLSISLVHGVVNRRNALAEAAASLFLVNNTEEWIVGTELPHLSPDEALKHYASNKEDGSTTSKRRRSVSVSSTIFPMARWPDPVLRIPAQPVSDSLWNSDMLFTIATMLRQTARKEGAVGLAAQQCGIDLSLIFIDNQPQQRQLLLPTTTVTTSHFPKDGTFLLNPRFVYRSPEADMMVWKERCLVMPPKFRATVLRDRRVVVESETLDGSTIYLDVVGENARVVQHECQHNEGILIVDHVDLDYDELVTDQMRLVEREKHFENQRRAFARPIVEPQNRFSIA